ncbi:3D domain-containing protein [Halochromatium salexigens]|uniref:3D domain-containing protein n=1 Tax=Halochromatium salexigens TaxID=49447 RepID=UPI001913841C|nr:3D domain-containing protein [Halochromatium salexigens]
MPVASKTRPRFGLVIAATLGLILVLILVLFAERVSKEPLREEPVGEARHRLEVKATAYTSRPSETSGDPYLAAWNNRLTPGEKSIAVSRDLLELGLTNGAKVEIEGLPGVYTVRDKMNKRWTRRIDIYMGNDLERAREWGRREVVLHW